MLARHRVRGAGEQVHFPKPPPEACLQQHPFLCSIVNKLNKAKFLKCGNAELRTTNELSQATLCTHTQTAQTALFVAHSENKNARFKWKAERWRRCGRSCWSGQQLLHRALCGPGSTPGAFGTTPVTLGGLLGLKGAWAACFMGHMTVLSMVCALPCMLTDVFAQLLPSTGPHSAAAASWAMPLSEQQAGQGTASASSSRACSAPAPTRQQRCWVTRASRHTPCLWPSPTCTQPCRQLGRGPTPRALKPGSSCTGHHRHN